MRQSSANVRQSGAEAWLLECGPTRVLVSAFNMLHVMEEAAFRFHIPMSPAYCNSVLVWQKRVMPVVNLAEWVNQPTTTPCGFSCVLGWKDVDGNTEYGVLATSAFPQRIMVSDEHRITASPELATMWQGYALCFVEHRNTVIPIIDPARLFGASQFVDPAGAETIGMIA